MRNEHYVLYGTLPCVGHGHAKVALALSGPFCDSSDRDYFVTSLWKDDHMVYYEQPYRMGRITLTLRVVYLDVIATCDLNALYLHTINRHFSAELPLQVDISDPELQPAVNGIPHILEVHLNNEPAAGESLAPVRIREMGVSVTGNQFHVRLPARSVTVVEVPLR